MHFPTLSALPAATPKPWAKAPVLAILCEDDVEIASTLAHHLTLGFKTIVLVLAAGVDAPADLPDGVHTLGMAVLDETFTTAAVNAIAASLPAGTWMGYVYNAEYLYFPFSEDRSVGEMLHFNTEERRDAVLTYVIDLYSAHLHGNGVDREWAHLDRSGYYALARDGTDGPKERQLDFFGGLRWRFEEHVPYAKRRIDRIGLFRTGAAVQLRADHTLNVEEMNTYACAWHHSLTATICSFRAAKALATNPGSRAAIQTFHWHNSVPFEWRAQQLMDLGLMEPGQWF